MNKESFEIKRLWEMLRDSKTEAELRTELRQLQLEQDAYQAALVQCRRLAREPTDGYRTRCAEIIALVDEVLNNYRQPAKKGGGK